MESKYFVDEKQLEIEGAIVQTILPEGITYTHKFSVNYTEHRMMQKDRKWGGRRMVMT